MRTIFEMTEHAKTRKSQGASWRSILNRAVNRAAKVKVWSEPMREAIDLERIRAKAAVFAANNPQPRAVYLIG